MAQNWKQETASPEKEPQDLTNVIALISLEIIIIRIFKYSKERDKNTLNAPMGEKRSRIVGLQPRGIAREFAGDFARGERSLVTIAWFSVRAGSKKLLMRPTIVRNLSRFLRHSIRLAQSLIRQVTCRGTELNSLPCTTMTLATLDFAL